MRVKEFFRSLLVAVAAVAVVAMLVVSPFCCPNLFSLASSSTMLTGSGLAQGSERDNCTFGLIKR